MTSTLHHGDSLDILAELEPDSVDAIVQDPPAGIGFMGRSWDSHSSYEPRTERGKAIAEALDMLALAPWERGFVGAHALTWALPRTADLTTLALRLAGWEVRDVIVHLFGQGFPKSHDVSKAIDKLAGAAREVVGSGPYASRRVNPNGGTTTSAFAHDGHIITAPATDDAKTWQGWGTALSPGHEHWVLARKPLAGTVARNVLAHGTGGINVDGCRSTLEKSARLDAVQHCQTGNEGRTVTGNKPGHVQPTYNTAGRWPKNALLSCSLACSGDDHVPWCPVAELDRQSGHTASPTKTGRGAGGQRGVYSPRAAQGTVPAHGDSGGASRFFPRFGYHAKASDRSVPGRDDIENKHPTHKHPELMRWLVRLITPPGGTVLDPFMGSGTTGVAAMREGVRFVGIEREREHFDVADARISAEVGKRNDADAQPEQLGLLART